MKPKLRPLEAQPILHQGQQSILLQDPLRLGPGPVVVPATWGPLLALCDGTRDLAELRAALAVRAGVLLSEETLQKVVARLDEALLLEGERARAALEEALAAYRAAPYRELASAGATYPANPGELRAYLQGFVEQAGPLADAPEAQVAWRGLISPHIDYARGGPVYARVFDLAARALGEVEQVIVFGTDHRGSPGITLTEQNYATPFGVLPTERGVVRAVAEAIGSQAAFAEELHHRVEHSIELAVVWLHYFLGGRSVHLVPILCGSFDPFVRGERDPAADPTLKACLAVLREALLARRTLVVAAADLAHVGPAFGDPRPLDFAARARLQAADAELLARVVAGDAEGFLQRIRQEGDRRRICGLPPIYLALRLLGEAQGVQAGYDRCPADAQGGSWVSICGVLLR